MQRIYLIERHTRTLMNFAFIGLCIYLLINGYFEIAGFMIAYNYKGRLFGFANYIVTIKDYISRCSLSAQRLNEIFDKEKYPLEKYGDVELINVKGEIEFDNVTFGYGEGKNVLDHINLKIKPNSMTAFVGFSGAGKSTIVSLIDRMYDIDEGDGGIYLDGVNIKFLTKDSLRNNICLISQNPYIFNMTLKENLQLANRDVTEEEMIDALKKANIWDYVEELPEKLESKLGENGIKLSGGQKQRIAISRALCKKSKVIIFDEATSALDNKNQAKVKETIYNLASDHTIIVIAHRLSTVVDCDNIVFIKDGKVEAQGNHKFLMQNCKDYNELYSQEDV